MRSHGILAEPFLDGDVLTIIAISDQSEDGYLF